MKKHTDYKLCGFNWIDYFLVIAHVNIVTSVFHSLSVFEFFKESPNQLYKVSKVHKIGEYFLKCENMELE